MFLGGVHTRGSTTSSVLHGCIQLDAGGGSAALEQSSCSQPEWRSAHEVLLSHRLGYKNQQDKWDERKHFSFWSLSFSFLFFFLSSLWPCRSTGADSHHYACISLGQILSRRLLLAQCPGRGHLGLCWTRYFHYHGQKIKNTHIWRQTVQAGKLCSSLFYEQSAHNHFFLYYF